MAFHFPLMPRMFMAVCSGDRRPITDMFLHTPPIPETCQWCLFLRNHDELTLEMCTDPERDYMYYAYAQDPRMKLNIGIRRRLAPLLENDRARIQLLNSLLFTLPGHADHLLRRRDRHGRQRPPRRPATACGRRCSGRRTGMPASRAPIRSSSTARSSPIPSTATRPSTSRRSSASTSSLLGWMRRLIAARKRSKVFGRGTLRFLTPANTRVLAHLREYRGETVLLVHNLAPSAEAVELDLADFRGAIPVELLGGSRFPAIGDRPYALTLAPYGSYWLRLDRPGRTPEAYGIERDSV